MDYFKNPHTSAVDNFLIWLNASKSLFKTQLCISSVTSNFIELVFVESHSNIRVNVGADEITVSFYWNDILWDSFVSYEAIPKPINKGFVCDLCDPDQLTVYPSVSAFWETHLFETFLDWVNTRLVTATHIEIYGSNENSSSAKLLYQKPTKSHTKLPADQIYLVIENPLFK